MFIPKSVSLFQRMCPVSKSRSHLSRRGKISTLLIIPALAAFICIYGYKNAAAELRDSV